MLAPESEEIFIPAMKWSRFAVLVLAITSLSAFSQNRSGTIVVIYLSNTKAVVAADSRVATHFANGSTTITDDGCKIAVLGDGAIFAESGVDGHGKPGVPSEYPTIPGWSMIDEARRSHAENAPSIGNVMQPWVQTVLQKFNLMAAAEPEFLRVQAETYGGVIANGFFIAGDPPTATQFVFTYDASRPVSPVTYRTQRLSCEGIPIGPFCGTGNTGLLKEFAMLETPRAQKENEDWLQQRPARKGQDDDALRAIRLVDLTIAYDSTKAIGGRVDAVKIENGKVRWIARKEGCPP